MKRIPLSEILKGYSQEKESLYRVKRNSFRGMSSVKCSADQLQECLQYMDAAAFLPYRAVTMWVDGTRVRISCSGLDGPNRLSAVGDVKYSDQPGYETFASMYQLILRQIRL